MRDDLTTSQERVNRTMMLLRDGLAPFVDRELDARRGTLPLDRLQHVKRTTYVADRPIENWDVAALLKVMEAVWNHVFRERFGRFERSLVSELLDWRNKWAHQEEFSSDNAERALDSAHRLLVAIGAPQADEVGRIRREQRALDATSTLVSRPVERAASSTTAVASSRAATPEQELQAPTEVLREVRAERHQSWSNLRKAVRALMDLPHEPFGTPNVAASSKSTVRLMARRTGLSLERLKELLDSM